MRTGKSGIREYVSGQRWASKTKRAAATAALLEDTPARRAIGGSGSGAPGQLPGALRTCEKSAT